MTEFGIAAEELRAIPTFEASRAKRELRLQARLDGRPLHALVDIRKIPVRGWIDKHSLVLLGAAGVIEKHGRWWRLPGDGSVGALWDACCTTVFADGVVMDDAFFAFYRRVRDRLLANSVPHPPSVLRGLVALEGVSRIRSKMVSRMLGDHGANIRIAELRTMIGQEGWRMPPVSRAPVERLLDVLPEDVRGRFRRQLLQRRHPPIVPPPETTIGRVLALPEGPIRTRTAIVLIRRSVDGISEGRVRGCARTAERHVTVLEGAVQTDPVAVASRLELYRQGLAVPLDRAYPRLVALQEWSILGREAERFVRLVLGRDAGPLLAMLPARHPEERDFDAAIAAAIAKVELKWTAARTVSAASVVTALTGILAAAENRTGQMEGLMLAMAERLPTALSDIQSGLRAGFEWTGPVVRPDGSLGDGEQTIRFRFEREENLLALALEMRPESRTVRARMARRPGGKDGFKGQAHRPERADQLHLVYDGVEAAVAGGEAHEPFFVDPCRWSLFTVSQHSPPSTLAIRRERLRATGLIAPRGIPRGLLTSRDEEETVIASFVREDGSGRGLTVVSLIEIYHAMAFARLAIHYGIRWGARMGEILQLRLGPDCFKSHRIEGVWRTYASLRPKGWLEDGRFGLDRFTSDLIRRLRLFSSARWHPGLVDDKGTPDLPTVPFGVSGRRLPDARYLFQAYGRQITAEALTWLCRFLLAGVVDMTMHDGRYAFATALGLEGAEYEEVGHLLHHSPSSVMPQKYDLSALLLSDDAAERFNQRVTAAVAGMSLG